MPVLTDPIADLLTRIRNAQAARSTSCIAPWSRIKQQLLELLKRDGWIADVRVNGEGVAKDIEVVFQEGKTLTLARVSKPGRRVFCKSRDMKPVLSGYGCRVLTTSQGLMTDAEARKRGLGGEVLCIIS
jgi:small subunit ribosomal protein S8